MMGHSRARQSLFSAEVVLAVPGVSLIDPEVEDTTSLRNARDSLYQMAWRHIAENLNLLQHRRQNLESLPPDARRVWPLLWNWHK